MLVSINIEDEVMGFYASLQKGIDNTFKVINTWYFLENRKGGVT